MGNSIKQGERETQRLGDLEKRRLFTTFVGSHFK